MKRQETAKAIKILKMVYPNSYKNATIGDVEETIELWTELFEKDDGEIVLAAVKKLVTELKYHPSIAEIKEEIKPKLFYPEE